MLFFALILLNSFVHAAPCRVLSTIDKDTNFPNFIVNSGSTGVITIVSIPTLPSDVEGPILKLLTDESTTLAKAVQTGTKILEYYHGAVNEQVAALTYLHERMTRTQVVTLIIDRPPHEVEKLGRIANQLYSIAIELQARAGSGDVTLDRLILLSVGAPMYARLVEPASFQLTQIEGMIVSEESVPPAAPPTVTLKLERPKKSRGEKVVSEDTSRRETDAYENARDKLRGQASTLQTFARLRERVREGEFKGKSLSAVKEQVLPGFWNKAHRPVSEYLDEALSAGGDKRHIKDQDEAEGTAGNESLIQRLLKKKDRTLVFATKEHYEILKSGFTAKCR